MDTIWQTAINGDVFKNLEHQVGLLAFSEFNLIILDENFENIYFNINNFKNLDTQIPKDETTEIRLVNNILIDFKRKIYDYLSVFDNTKSYFYLEVLVELSKTYKPIYRRDELYYTFDSIIEKQAEFQGFFNERYSHLDNITISKLKIEVFEFIYKLYSKNYSIFENLINNTYKDFREGNIDKNLFEINQIILKNNPVFNIDKKYDVSDIRSKSNSPTLFNPVVTALLFNYLKEKKVILDFNTSSLAKLISISTMISENNLRTKIIPRIVMLEAGKYEKSQKYKKNSALPYEILKEILNSILDDVEIQIKKLS